MCRPRKVILLVNANEAALGMQRFMLETRGYRVLIAHDAAAALALHALGVDLVLGSYLVPDLEWGMLTDRMKAAEAQTPILWLGHESMVKNPAHAVEQVLYAKRTCTAELLERIRVLVRRKRGPRKKLALLPAVAAD